VSRNPTLCCAALGSAPGCVIATPRNRCAISQVPRPSSAVTPPQLSSSAWPAAARPPLATSRDHGTRPCRGMPR